MKNNLKSLLNNLLCILDMLLVSYLLFSEIHSMWNVSGTLTVIAVIIYLIILCGIQTVMSNICTRSLKKLSIGRLILIYIIIGIIVFALSYCVNKFIIPQLLQLGL